MPFHLRSVTSLLHVEALTLDKFNAHECPRVTLTHRDLTWDPGSTVYEDQENNMTDWRGDIIRPDPSARGPLMVINSVCMSTCENAADVCHDENFGNVLQSKVNVSIAHMSKPNVMSQVSYEKANLGNIQSGVRGKKVNSATLAKRWGIDPLKAATTVRTTTQRGVRSTLHPTLSRRYPTNDRMMR